MSIGLPSTTMLVRSDISPPSFAHFQESLPGFDPTVGKLGCGGAANFSPPPCGEGVGAGGVRCCPPVPHGSPPHPNPPPQGGRESTAAPSRLNLARLGDPLRARDQLR